MKKVKLGGRRQKKTSNFMSEDEEDGGLGLDGRKKEGGREGGSVLRGGGRWEAAGRNWFVCSVLICGVRTVSQY